MDSKRKPNPQTPQAHRTSEPDAGICYFCEPVLAGIRERRSLTQKEAVICQCLVLGDDRNETAKLLGIAVSTVGTHLERIERKFGVRSQVALAVKLILTVRRECVCVSAGESPAWEGSLAQ